MQAYKKAEEMTTLIEAAHALLIRRPRSRRIVDRSASFLPKEVDRSKLSPDDQNGHLQGRRRVKT